MSRGKAEEARLQAKCVIWLWNERPQTRSCFILIDNNATHMIAAMQKRSMGMIGGAADTFFFWNKKLYFFEFKFGGNKQSPAQKAFENVAKVHSSGYFLVYSFEYFCSTIDQILAQD